MSPVQTMLAWVDWFVPETHRSAAASYGGNSDVFRARLVVMTSAVVGLVMVMLTVVRIIIERDFTGTYWLLAVGGVIAAALPFVTRWCGSRMPAAIVLVVLALLLLPQRTWATGGLSSTVLAWYCLVPLVAWFAIGRRGGVVTTVLAMVQVAMLAGAETAGLLPAEQEFSPALRLFSMVVLLGLILCLTWLHDIERHTQVQDLSALLTELGRSNEALERKSAEAEQAARAKSDFLATMSHELRTPLNGVMGMTQLLADSPLHPEQKTWVSTLQTSAHLLLAVINDVLEISRLNAGKVEIASADFATDSLISDVADLLGPTARAKGLTLQTELCDSLPAGLHSDKMRLQQVLMNLIGNAIKFTSTGHVRVSASWHEDARGGTLRLEVIDTGIGIETHAYKRIFDRFSQADASTSRRFGGSGLGLTISAGLVGLMGGAMGVESKVRQGSTFWVEVPAQAVQLAPAGLAVAAPARPAPMGLGARVLVVEDNPVNQMVVRQMLRKLGHDVHVVDGGEEALARWAEERFDLVLMDCEMPGIDGYETTRRLRAIERPGQHTPVVALTAHALPEAIARCLEAGMDDHLAKPLLLEALEAMLGRYLFHEAA